MGEIGIGTTTVPLTSARKPPASFQLQEIAEKTMKYFRRAVYALCALSGLAAADPPFAVSSDGKEVADPRSGLTWRRCAEGMVAKGGSCTGAARTFSYDGAAAHAKMQASATRVSWRLPTLDELLTIADEKRFKLAIDTNAFPATPAEHFWTSTPYIENYVYAVSFYNGFHYDRYKTSPHHVRLVRTTP